MLRKRAKRSVLGNIKGIAYYKMTKVELISNSPQTSQTYIRLGYGCYPSVEKNYSSYKNPWWWISLHINENRRTQVRIILGLEKIDKKSFVADTVQNILDRKQFGWQIYIALKLGTLSFYWNLSIHILQNDNWDLCTVISSILFRKTSVTNQERLSNPELSRFSRNSQR